MKVFHIVMNGNPPAPEFHEEIGLSHPGDFSPASQRDALIYEKSQSQIQPGLVFGQIQPAQNIIMDRNQHRASLTASMLAGKCGKHRFCFILHFAFCILPG